MTDEQFATLITEIRGLRADLRRAYVGDTRTDLVAAIADYFGPGTFTAAGVLEVVGECPGDDLALAVSQAIDLAAPAPAIALGRLFSRLRHLEPVGERRGAGLWRVREEVEDNLRNLRRRTL